jgi:hypothetical protein
VCVCKPKLKTPPSLPRSLGVAPKKNIDVMREAIKVHLAKYKNKNKKIDLITCTIKVHKLSKKSAIY